MPTDDEFRRVAEDVRALARSLARDIRGAVDRAREEPVDGQVRHDPVSAASRAARDELLRAKVALRQAARQHGRCSWPEPRGLGSRPRWDHWGRPRHGQLAAPGADAAAAAARGSDAAERTTSTMARRPPAPPPPPLRHRHDGSTLLGLLAVVFGLAWLAAGTRVVNVSAEGVLAVALMVLGVTMVITARTDWALSRRGWPLLAGGLLLVALIASSSSPSLAGDFRHVQFGSRTVAASSWADVPAVVKGGVGQTVVDLTAISDPLAAPRTLEVYQEIGNLVVRLPTNLAVTVDANAGAGSIVVNGTNVASGFRPSYHRPLVPSATGPILTLRLRSGVGAVRVTDMPPVNPLMPSEPLPPKEPQP